MARWRVVAILVVVYMFVSSLLVQSYVNWEITRCPPPYVTVRQKLVLWAVMPVLYITLPVWSLFLSSDRLQRDRQECSS